MIQITLAYGEEKIIVADKSLHRVKTNIARIELVALCGIAFALLLFAELQSLLPALAIHSQMTLLVGVGCAAGYLLATRGVTVLFVILESLVAIVCALAATVLFLVASEHWVLITVYMLWTISAAVFMKNLVEIDRTIRRAQLND